MKKVKRFLNYILNLINPTKCPFCHNYDIYHISTIKHFHKEYYCPYCRRYFIKHCE